MVVTRSSFEKDVLWLQQCSKLSLDTETTGLRPYHGDRLFSIILGAKEPEERQYYFNFQPYDGVPQEQVLTPRHLTLLQDLLFSDETKTWYIHRARFDLPILAQDRLSLAGEIHCTQAIARVEYNEHLDYDLDSCGERIGYRKDDTVSRYIKDHKLTEKRQAAVQLYTHQFYDRVPFDIIVPYGEQDAAVGCALGYHQEAEIGRLANDVPSQLPSLRSVFSNEKRLTRTLFRMADLGVRIDRPYCVQAAQYETTRAEEAMVEFQKLTGDPYKQSPKLFERVFVHDRDRWGVTDKGNPSFDSEALKHFEHPAARQVLVVRDATSKANFYKGFLYHADRNDVIHPTINQDGANHGRTSSANPNLQNLTSEEILTCKKCKRGFEEVVTECDKCGATEFDEPPFLVRRAFIPRPGYIFIMPDYDQMEYRMMFDKACSLLGYPSRVVKEILNGKDPHQATADVVTENGTPLTRSRAKNGNFAWLYGSGDRTLAATIGSSVEEARTLRRVMAAAAPEVDNYVQRIIATAAKRGWIFNWMGRRSYFPSPRFAYRAPNYDIAGGCADVVKVAMNRIDEMFLSTKSKMVLMIHDELPCEIHESEVATMPRRVKEHMEAVYPSQFLPLTTGMEWSEKSLADKRKGFPV